MTTSTPSSVDILTYRVGFGDCFLLRFNYRRGIRRHVLIDFGTASLPREAAVDHMEQVARSISSECRGSLEAIVATHRHLDHISGFSADSVTGEIIAGCRPKLVVQPWTEDPRAARNASSPTAAFIEPGASEPVDELLAAGRAFVGRLDQLSDAAERVSKLDVAPALSFLGEVGIKNKSSILNLQKMGREAGPSGCRYAYHGSDSGFTDDLLPGVKVTVLGPPTLRQTRSIEKMVEADPEEFWMLTRLDQYIPDLPGSGTRVAIRQAAARRIWVEDGPSRPVEVPPYARWLVERLGQAGHQEQLAIMRKLDGVLNNTSLILLFEVGPVKLLFPGDAQLENWNFALAQPGVRELLAGVRVYKVGHHGSRNATPRSLWDGFVHRSIRPGANRLITLLSTRSGKCGERAEHTEVPRDTLLAELRAKSTLTNSDEAGPELFCPVTLDVR